MSILWLQLAVFYCGGGAQRWQGSKHVELDGRGSRTAVGLIRLEKLSCDSVSVDVPVCCVFSTSAFLAAHV